MSAPGTSEARDEVAVPIWDLPVRLAHWSLVVLLVLSWLTGKYGALAWHRASGYAILGLVLFRIYWGFTGSSTARFAHFLRGPRAVWGYSKTLLERVGSKRAGHNPLGGWSVVTMLLLLLLQTGLGLFAVDVDGIESGPLADLVSFDTGRQMARWHAKTVDVLLVVIALHLAAILHYWFYKRENLIAAMLTGVKRMPREAGHSITFATLRRAIIGLAVAGLAVAAVVTRFGF